MGQLTTTYDDVQHCTAEFASKAKSVTMDCPYTGKGEELSPGNVLEAALAGCMLMSMGAVATRDGIDLKKAEIEGELVGTRPPKIGYDAISVFIRMPIGIDRSYRATLERAADACPIKHSFDPRIRVSTVFGYFD